MSSSPILLATWVDRIGGAERMLLTLADGLPDRWEPRLAAVSSREDVPSGLGYGPTHASRPGGGPGAGTGAGAGFGRVPRRLHDARALLAGRFRVIHTHLFLPGLLARLRRMVDPDFRWVHTVHYQGYDGQRLARLRAVLDHRWIFPATDALVAVSATVAEGLPAMAQLRVIPNALDLAPAGAALGGAESASAEGPPTVGCMAMLRAEKGLDRLIRAAGILRDRGVEVRTLIAGEGPMRGSLESLVEELGLSDRVALLGYVGDPSDFYPRLTVYAQPSRTESFGLAAAEALRFALPVVATRVGYLGQLLDGGRFGSLVPSSDETPERMADAIESALGDLSAARARSEAGRAFWAGRLDPGRYVERHVRTYEDVCRPRAVHVAALATHGGGGIPRQTLLQTRALTDLGHRVFLVQRNDPGMADDEVRREAWSHLTLVQTRARTDEGVGAVRAEGLWFVVRAAWRLWRMRRRYDVVHAHQLFSPTLAGVVAGLFTGKPVVVKVTSSGAGVGELNELRRLPLPRLRRLAFRRVARFIALTRSMRRELVAEGFPAERVVVIPNAVEVPGEAVHQPVRQDGPYRLVFTGRLSTEKSLDTVVAAVALAAGWGHEVEAHLVGGPDPDRDATPGLIDLMERTGVGSRIVLHGSRPSVEPYLRDADAFVLPSVNEGMSNALLEAMALGMVCLASDIPQNRDLIEDGRTGLLFPVGDAESLARRIADLKDDRDGGGALARRLGGAARARIETGYSGQVVGEKISRLYASLVTPP